MVISRGRWILDRIATHILAAAGDSQWTFCDGNYQEYEADKRKRLGEERAKPKRIRFKAFELLRKGTLVDVSLPAQIAASDSGPARGSQPARN